MVVTGMGAVTPLGNTVDDFWAALQRAESGVGPITKFDASAYPTRIAGEVRDFEPLAFVDRKEARRLDPCLVYAIAAATMAFEDAKLKQGVADARRMGVIVGSSIGGITTLLQQHRALIQSGPRKVSPFLIPMLTINMAAGLIAMRLGAKGPHSAIAAACATGNHAIGDSFRTIQRGDADVMLAGGSEAIVVDITLAGFGAMDALSRRNDAPHRASRPFDADRDGFVFAEGAGILVLESLEHATRRDASIYGEVVGFGTSSDAHHITAPHPRGEGAVNAMAAALRDGALAPTDIDYINAHGTSTPQNDQIETLAIKRLFEDHAYKLMVSSTKSMTGHMFGAAGAVEAIATLLTLRCGIVPPTINYETADPECDLDYVPNRARRYPVRTALSNGFGFGGVNSTLAFRTYDSHARASGRSVDRTSRDPVESTREGRRERG